GGVVDYGDPARRYGQYAQNTRTCKDDGEVVEGVAECINGDVLKGVAPVNFLWARLVALEQCRKWNSQYQHFIYQVNTSSLSSTSTDIQIPPPPEPPSTEELAIAAKAVAENIKKIYDSLPKCTAFIVYSGAGDPLEM